jgi:hypothetical protein
MTALDFTEGRAECGSQPEIVANRETGTQQEPRRSRMALEIGATFLALILIALGSWRLASSLS